MTLPLAYRRSLPGVKHNVHGAFHTYNLLSPQKIRRAVALVRGGVTLRRQSPHERGVSQYERQSRIATSPVVPVLANATLAQRTPGHASAHAGIKLAFMKMMDVGISVLFAQFFLQARPLACSPGTSGNLRAILNALHPYGDNNHATHELSRRPRACHGRRCSARALRTPLWWLRLDHAQAQWTDPRFTGQSLRGAKVLVVCTASATAIKHICQDQLAAQVAAAAATPVVPLTLTT